MLQFLANITFLFKEYDFIDRFSKAKESGFTSVEFKFPEPLNVDAVESKLKETGLKPYLFNFPVDIQAVGGRGVANNPDKKKEFRQGVEQAVATACRLGVKNINFFCGTKLSSYSEEEMWDTLVSNLQYAADELKKHKLNITFEPLNHHDNPDIFIESTTKALKLHKEVGKDNIFIQYDLYHSRQEGEDIFAMFRNNMHAIGHIQIADHPGRHQPGTGEIEMEKFLRMIDESEYKGYVSLEYIPMPDTLSSLKWFRDNGLTFNNEVI
jgi:hydroxypyruvate isomerase